MNKTVSIHIQGFAFILEEQAYDALRNYLNELSRVLQHEEGKDEILQDIELRIVELLQEKVAAQQVVQLPQILEIIQLLGSPEVFGEEESKTTNQTAEESTEPLTAPKRFFRDADTALLGGVASGVAAYFNVDVVFIRVAFVLFTMVFGSGIPIYILLWIITPSAKTASEKLQMRGRAVNVESIKTEFKEATERVERNARKWSSQLRTGSGLSTSLSRLLEFIKRAVGIFLILFGFSLIVSLGILIFLDPSLIPAQINGEHSSLGELSMLFFETKQMHLLVYVGVSFIGFAWGLSSLLLGFRMLFEFHAKWLKSGLTIFGAVAIFGIFSLVYVGVSTAQSFAIEGELSKEIGTYSGDSLQLEISNDLHLAAFGAYKLGFSKNGYKVNKHPDQGLILTQNGNIYISGVEIQYEESSDSLYHVKIVKRANGSSYLKANRRASKIHFPCHLDDSSLVLSSGFSFPVKDHLRDQEVALLLSVPRGKVVLWKDQVVYPYYSLATPDEATDRAYVHGDGEYSAW
jgi:phage shock protein PspC (stress-responsive transcriptional regulator)